MALPSESTAQVEKLLSSQGQGKGDLIRSPAGNWLRVWAPFGLLPLLLSTC